MKTFTNWIMAHKLLSIILAAVVTVGAATAIVLPIALKHEHTFAAEWSQDEENHWHSCTGKDCDEIADKAAHVYDNTCDVTCNVCGATRTAGAHVYDNGCDATCNVCGVTREVGEHVYDNACDDSCNVCGATRTAPHAFAETWTCDKENHWLACTEAGCTVMKDKAEHRFSVKENATQHWNECSTCGYKVYTSVSAARYENALNFKDEDGNFYHNIDIVFVNGTTKVFQYTVTDSAAYRYHLGDADNDETIWTNENGRGVIYTKKDANSQWVRTEYTEPFTDFASFVLPVPSIRNYLTSLPLGDKLTYSKEDQMYHGSYKQGTTVTVDVSMRFEDGKLVNLMHESTNSNSGTKVNGTRTVTYGNAVIQIPKAEEVGKQIAVLPYNNGVFATDARLSAGDNWFVFDITSAMIAEYGNEMSGNFTVPNANAALTITVKAYNGSNTEITNDAVANGAMYFEGLTAGKYYLKITVNEACTGSLHMTIAV